MATSGQIRTNTSFGYVQLAWSTQSQDIANNRSIIAYTLSINRTSNISSSASKSYWININGTEVSGTTTIGGIGTKTLATGNVTIPHNADGSKIFSYSFAVQVDITWSGAWIGTVTGSGNGTLNNIARATQPTLNVASQYMNSVITINTPRASSSFTHTLRYGFGSLRETIATGVLTSYSWTLPMNMANQIGNATSGVGLIWCDTYNGSTLIGTKEIAFTAKVPENIKPYFSSITASDSTGAYSYFGTYIQNKSKVSVVSNALGVYSSQIVSYKHEILGSTYSTKDFTSGLLSSSGEITIVSTCTDTRGRTGTATTVINVAAYESPKINSFTGFRALSDGTQNYDGTYLKCNFNFAISPINNFNTKQYQIQYKLKSATSWTTLVNNTSVYSADTSYISGNILADVNSYDVRLVVSDYFSSVQSTIDIGTAFTILDFRSTGKGMAIGKVSEKDILEIAIPTEIDGQPIQGGAITVYQNGQQAITTNAYTKCNFNSLLAQAGDNFVLNNNNIVCQKTGLVEVSAMISITGGVVSGDNYYIFAFKEDASGNGTSLNISAKTIGTDWATIQLTPVIVNVAAGDKIYISILNNNARGSISNGDNLAWMNKLTVKYCG